VHTRSAAGQASIEYVAAIALIAAVFMFAGPAVGAPGIGKQVAHGIRLGVCLVAHDVCSTREAKADGLAACALRTDIKGHEVTGTAFSIELGGRETLTVTPQSDGTVSVVRTVGGSVGVADGIGAGYSAGPVAIEVGPSGAARARVQVARAWSFPDQAGAARFLEHAVRNTVNEHEFPAAWHSLEGGAELAASVGASVGHKDVKERADLVGAAASASAALGGRVARDGTITLYGRLMAQADFTWPVLSTAGHGTNQWVVEYTFDRHGPRELAFRTATPSDWNHQLTETVGRLDLRDPGNLAAARSLVDAAFPWPPDLVGRVRDVFHRIETNGTIEQTTSAVDDDTWGVSAHESGEVKFGVSYTRIKTHRTLIDATALTRGSSERDRFDCTGDHP
jgi:hypothetical protein